MSNGAQPEVALTRNTFQMLALFAVCVTLSSSNQKPPDIVGKWEAWIKIDGPLTRYGASGYGSKWEIDLLANGHYSEDIVNHIMADVVSHTEGTYKVVGTKVYLDGVAKFVSSEGDKSASHTGPEKQTLNIVRGMLVLPRSDDNSIYYIRVGKNPPDDLLHPKPGPSDSKAVAIIHQLESTYSGFKLYVDQGTSTSTGKAFEAKHATFTTSFDRKTHKFRYEAKLDDHGQVYKTTGAWSDGKKSWLYDSE